MIIVPVMSLTFYSVSVIKLIFQCSRCTFSLSETKRATNGHRFVFQSSEVSGTERRYVSNEKGIIPFDTRGINTVEPYTHPIDSLTTAPALDFTNILDYSQQQPFEQVSRASLLVFLLYNPTNPLYSILAAEYTLLHFSLARLVSLVTIL